MNAFNFVNPAYLARIKAAIVAATIQANSPHRINGRGVAVVLNSRGKPSLGVIARRGHGFEVMGGADLDSDVTHFVVPALRRYHATGMGASA